MRLLIISDIHANLAALRCVEEIETVAFLGDAVDYGPCPAECVAWLQKRPMVAVRGNHDNAVGLGEDPRCSPAFQVMAAATCALHRQILPQEQKNFLAALPICTTFDFGGTRFYAVHAAPRDPLFGYLPRDISDDQLADQVRDIDAEVILMGHTHWPMVRKAAGKLIVNPGSVGQPKHGDPRAAYAVWDDGQVTLRRAEYPVEDTVRELQRQPLPANVIADLAAALRSGQP